MDRKLISLNELKLYVKSKGKNKNKKVETFLNNVFEIGFSFKYSDIFSMQDFEYGDLLVLNYEFLYEEYLKFLGKNETHDDVLFYIAEFEYANFYENIQYTLKNIRDFTSYFKTRKQLIEEEKEKKRQEEIRRKEEEDRRKKLIEGLNENKEIESEPLPISENRIMNEEASMMMDFSSYFSRKEDLIPPETIQEKIFRLLDVRINDALPVNIFARSRIEEHLINISSVKKKIGNVFND